MSSPEGPGAPATSAGGEALGQVLFDALPALVWRTGPDGKARGFNRTWLAFTGRALEQELGDGWLEGLHPSEHDATVLGYFTAFQARKAFQLEHRLRRSDGEYRWMVSTGSPLGQGDAFEGFVGLAVDITDPRRAEAAAIDARATALAAEARAHAARWELLERELGALEVLSSPAEGARRRPAVAPLSEQSPPVFAELASRYGELLDVALARQAYKNVADPSDGLRSLGERLGSLRAGPRDVVDLHTRVLGGKARAVPYAKAQAYVAEGRLMALELMGYLVTFYRNAAFGLPDDEDGVRSPGGKGRGPGHA